MATALLRYPLTSAQASHPCSSFRRQRPRTLSVVNSRPSPAPALSARTSSLPLSNSNQCTAASQKLSTKDTHNPSPPIPRSGPLGFNVEGLAPLSFSLWLLSAFPSYSEEVEAAVDAAVDIPDWFTQSVLAIPIVAYGLFYYVRAKYNPKAGLLDYFFLLAVVVIFSNVFTSIVFKIRLY